MSSWGPRYGRATSSGSAGCGLRSGHVRIRRAEVLSAPGGPATSVVTTRTARRFRLGVWADGLAWVLAAVLAVNLIAQVTGAFA